MARRSLVGFRQNSIVVCGTLRCAGLACLPLPVSRLDPLGTTGPNSGGSHDLIRFMSLDV